ncbi:glycine-rich protein 5 [Spinacia oleracea]|uniref:Glycine-rich protein 5 n=1 Tax=Spinacia oleracea TaxID=3562 RepID=A0A9R0JII4_SPIOL|nr:glycine-rich protein 5-like [Spinacia oleracea]
MARCNAALVLAVALLVVMVNHSAFGARTMQMSTNTKANVVDIDATRANPSGGLADNKNLLFGGVGSAIGGTAGLIGPFGGVVGGAGVGGGVGGVAFPVGGLVGGGVGGAGGVGGIIP